MELQYPFRVVTPTLDGDVLTVLAQAESTFTISEIQRLVGRGSVEGLRRVLERLARQGVVLRFDVGSSHAYSLNREHLAAAAIVALAQLSSTLRSRIAERLASWTHPPVFAAIFGSAVHDAMHAESDIDLLAVYHGEGSDAWHSQVDSLAREITAWTGNDARPLVYSADEIRGRAASESILRDIAHEGIVVSGERTEFERLIGLK